MFLRLTQIVFLGQTDRSFGSGRGDWVYGLPSSFALLKPGSADNLGLGALKTAYVRPLKRFFIQGRKLAQMW